MRPNLTRSDVIEALRMRSYPPLLACRPLWIPLTACVLVRCPSCERTNFMADRAFVPGSLAPSSSTSVPEYVRNTFFCAADSPAGLRSRNYVPFPTYFALPSLTWGSSLHSFHLFSYQAFTAPSLQCLQMQTRTRLFSPTP